MDCECRSLTLLHRVEAPRASVLPATRGQTKKCFEQFRDGEAKGKDPGNLRIALEPGRL